VREELTQKDSIEFDENFYSLTVLCFLKDVKAKYALSSNMQNSNFFNCVQIIVMQMIVIYCELWNLFIDELEDDQKEEYFYTTKFPIMIVRFPCAVAIAMELHPKVKEGMDIMKFANNQTELFSQRGSRIAFFLGITNVIVVTSLFVLNIIKLADFDSVEQCVKDYITFKMAIEIPSMFYNALADKAIKKVFEFPVQRKNRGRDIKFMERTTFHKCARILYKVFRSLYVSLLFYMSPFLVYAIIYTFGDTRAIYEEYQNQ
jgi:hypothetical protein